MDGFYLVELTSKRDTVLPARSCAQDTRRGDLVAEVRVFREVSTLPVGVWHAG